MIQRLFKLLAITALIIWGPYAACIMTGLDPIPPGNFLGVWAAGLVVMILFAVALLALFGAIIPVFITSLFWVKDGRWDWWFYN